jgi:hypothetical protein
MTKMTRKTNLTIVVKVVDLDINHIYNHNHMVGWDKISFYAHGITNFQPSSSSWVNTAPNLKIFRLVCN